jgi:hypothetical protein
MYPNRAMHFAIPEKRRQVCRKQNTVSSAMIYYTSNNVSSGFGAAPPPRERLDLDSGTMAGNVARYEGMLSSGTVKEHGSGEKNFCPSNSPKVCVMLLKPAQVTRPSTHPVRVSSWMILCMYARARLSEAANWVW